MREFEIEGKKRPFLFGLSAATPILEVVYSGETNEGSITLSVTKKAAEVAFLAFSQGARANKQEIDFTQEEVSVWLDLDFEIFQAITEEMQTFLSNINEKKSRELKPSSGEVLTALKKSKPVKPRKG